MRDINWHQFHDGQSQSDRKHAVAEKHDAFKSQPITPVMAGTKNWI
jgi:hypothetical protein